jgi:hypothetical protein
MFFIFFIFISCSKKQEVVYSSSMQGNTYKINKKQEEIINLNIYFQPDKLDSKCNYWKSIREQEENNESYNYKQIIYENYAYSCTMATHAYLLRPFDVKVSVGEIRENLVHVNITIVRTCNNVLDKFSSCDEEPASNMNILINGYTYKTDNTGKVEIEIKPQYPDIDVSIDLTSSKIPYPFFSELSKDKYPDFKFKADNILSNAKNYISDKEKEDKKKYQEQQDKISTEEVSSGKCNSDRYTTLSQHLSFLKTSFSSMNSSRDYWQLDSKDILVLSSNEQSYEYKAIVSGEYHFYFFTFSQARFSIIDKLGNEINQSSDYEAVARSNTSRSTTLASGDKLKIIMKGVGCSMLVVLRK